MEDNKIRKLANLMQELDLTGLEISENDCSIRLERDRITKDIVPDITIEKPQKEDKSSNLVAVTSPMVGVFYSAPSENADPFVKVGDKINKGDVLCIIESMKLMNDIISEQEGIVEEICVENGQTVDFGHVLLRLRKERE